MKTKTTLFLSIIITAYFVGKIFNPLPFTNYSFYLIVVALFIPYFGWWGCLKITMAITTFSLIQDIPFYLNMMQQWPMIYQAITIGTNATATTAIETTIANTQGSGVVFVLMLISGFYLSVIGGLYSLSKAFKKIGIYKRLQL